MSETLGFIERGDIESQNLVIIPPHDEGDVTDEEMNDHDIAGKIEEIIRVFLKCIFYI